jgi:periplasmic protein TonB
MLLDRREDIKAKLAGGAAALAIEAAFVSLLLLGLSVSYVKQAPRTTTLVNVPYQPIRKDLPPPKPPLQKNLPDDLRAPDFVIDKPVLPVTPVTPPTFPIDLGAAPLDNNGTDSGFDFAGPPDTSIKLPKAIVRLPAGIDQRYAAYMQPDYPAAARRSDMEGKVELRVLVGTDGRIKQAEIKRSSGHAVLDAAALEHALKKWRLTPASQDGVAVESWLVVPIRFELKHA